MADKFHGDFATLKGAVASTGIIGDWSETAGQMQYRAATGGILNWWPSTGTLLFQGGSAAAEELREKVLPLLNGGSGLSSSPSKTKIFVVHGHDAVSRDQLELVLHRFNLDPFVLMNTAGGGMAIIEALESQIGKEPEAAFGIVLMTPDDFGYSKAAGDPAKEPRARQNVILEMGMLLSSLTRKRVAILVKGHVELPSDIAGVIYLHFNDHVREIVPKLAERLQASGISLTAEQIAKASS